MSRILNLTMWQYFKSRVTHLHRVAFCRRRRRHRHRRRRRRRRLHWRRHHRRQQQVTTILIQDYTTIYTVLHRIYSSRTHNKYGTPDRNAAVPRTQH